jgi:DNA-binding ferritin-like protein
MPIVKKQDGWWWGSSHGPYPTKQKAIQVGQAAHAAGFKEESIMNKDIIGEFVGTLLHSATIAHIMHLQAVGNGSFAKHSALGTYYDAIVKTTDSLAEAIQGCTGEIIKSYPPMFGNPATEALDYLKSIREYVIANRDSISDYSNIQNEIDNIMTLLDSTIYKLTFLR